jgi:DNA-binding CsgD family transcriptional regulator
MSKSILTEYSNLLLTIYRQAQELPVDEFQDRILDAVKAFIPFDTSMWGTARMTATGIDIHSLHLHNTTQAMIDAYEQVKHLDVAAMRVTEQPTATIGFSTASDFEQPGLEPYREFLHDFRHENFFITSDINPVTRFAHWVSLYRADKTQVCTPQETELLACIAPHLMQALAINRLVHLDRLTGDETREKWSVAIADSRGILYHADKRFLELVRAEWPGGDAEKLPDALLDRLMAEDNQVAVGQRVVVRRSLERGLLFLKARDRAPVDSLTARELLVGRLLASGLSQKQVAAKLDRSPETIRSQVKGIFEKLDINNVALLAPMLMLRD